MTKEEIKARCRKAFLLIEDGTIFGKDPLQMVNLFRDESHAQEVAKYRNYDQHHMEFNKNKPKRKITVCPVYMVPASKIDR